ncbi:MAG: SDR family NAD(P)-dependent oxidoreductase [Polyangiaceae bacterium]
MTEDGTHSGKDGRDVREEVPGVGAMTDDDVNRIADVLESCIEDRTRLLAVSDDVRKRLLMVAGRLSRPTRDELIRGSKAIRKVKRRKAREEDRVLTANTEIRRVRAEAVFVAPALRSANGDVADAAAPPELNKPRHCYVCKVEYRHVHAFYESMCHACAEFNYAKRFQTADMRGQVAVITGARLKIGYQAALMMLRAGATVVATTRFPQDAAARYAREKDFEEWGSRLRVHGLDLRHAPSVELFASYLDRTLGRLDHLLNNAAQTVRRPPAFYAHLLAGEEAPYASLPAREKSVLRDHHTLVGLVAGGRAHLELGNGDARENAAPAAGPGGALSPWASRAGSAGVGILRSAALSQIPYAQDDTRGVEALFPSGAVDADLQQVDLRGINTWRLTLAEVATAEMLEVHLVNAVAPFVLCGKLKPLMMRDRTDAKHVVNVSAMEGSFSRRTKTDKHPHTNMAKAALNMMTLTSAPDYLKSGIHMNAVDTGWVTDEDPAAISARKRQDLDFEPPLDIVDGAARIVDPIFAGLNGEGHVWGKFLKDYKPTAW